MMTPTEADSRTPIDFKKGRSSSRESSVPLVRKQSPEDWWGEREFVTKYYMKEALCLIMYVHKSGSLIF